MEARARELVNGTLPLFGAHAHLQFAGIAELALFASEQKPALRYVLTVSGGRKLASIAVRSGYAATVCLIRSRAMGNGWNCLISDGSSDDSSQLSMVTIARDGALAQEVQALETSGSSHSVGLILGYPQCCIVACDELADAGARWAYVLLMRSGPGPHSFWANRLAAGWGGISPVGEMFPCSLSCPAAADLGRAAESALRNIGLVRLADLMVGHALESITVTQEGCVARNSAPLKPPGAVVVDFTARS